MKLLSNEPLCRHTTLRTGGLARWMIEAETEEQIREGVSWATGAGISILVLGGGSNVLAADAGFDGLVLKVASRGMISHPALDGKTEVIAEAGEEWDGLVEFSVQRGLFGLENLSLIPGRVGGAVIGNIGAYGAEIRDSLLWADALDIRTQTLRRFIAEECEFGYRRSVFKSLEGRQFIVTRAAFGLRGAGEANTSYRDVAEWFAASGVLRPSPAEVREAVVAIRRRKMPDPAQVGTAGSFFKNPVIGRAEYERLTAQYPGLPGQEDSSGRMKVPLGWVLDKVCGLRGARRGPVGTHAGQALVIVNEGGSAAQVEAFADEIAQQVRERTGIRIEWEVERV